MHGRKNIKTQNYIHKQFKERLVPVKYSCHGLGIFIVPFPTWQLRTRIFKTVILLFYLRMKLGPSSQEKKSDWGY